MLVPQNLAEEQEKAGAKRGLHHAVIYNAQADAELFCGGGLHLRGLPNAEQEKVPRPERARDCADEHI